MARKLILAWHRFGQEWFYLPDFLLEIGIHGRDESGLHYFGLIEEATEKRDDGGRAGWWRVTPRGGLFAGDMIKVPRHVRVYDGNVQGYVTDEMITIRDALGNKFDYDKLMQGIA